MSKTSLLVHIVFATKRRDMSLNVLYKRELFAYIFGIIKNKGCFVHRINGMADHIHLLIDLNPTIALADLIKEIKRTSSIWLSHNPKFPLFDGWGTGYYATSISVDGIENCINYIKNQELHHLRVELLGELQSIAKYYGLQWHDDDWK